MNELVVIGGVVVIGLLAWLAFRAKAEPEPDPEPEPGKGLLKVDTKPVKGQVSINGISKGVAPISANLEPGSYTISVGTVIDYITPASVTAEVVEGQTTNITLIYEKIAPEPEFASLSGIVTDSDTGSPIRRIKAVINGKSTETNSTGAYSFANLAPRDYHISFTDPHNDLYIGVSMPIRLTAGVNTLNVTLEKREVGQAVLNITTTDKSGAAVNGEIYVDGALKGTGAVSLQLPAGTYRISFGNIDGYITPTAIEKVLQGGGHYSVVGVYRAISGTASLQGIVRDSAGSGIYGVLVKNAYGTYSTTTSYDGSYLIEQMQPHYDSFHFTKSGYMPVNKSITLVAGMNTLDATLVEGPEETKITGLDIQPSQYVSPGDRLYFKMHFEAPFQYGEIVRALVRYRFNGRVVDIKGNTLMRPEYQGVHYIALQPHTIPYDCPPGWYSLDAWLGVNKFPPTSYDDRAHYNDAFEVL